LFRQPTEVQDVYFKINLDRIAPFPAKGRAGDGSVQQKPHGSISMGLIGSYDSDSPSDIVGAATVSGRDASLDSSESVGLRDGIFALGIVGTGDARGN